MISEKKLKKALNKKVSWFFGPSLGGVGGTTPPIGEAWYKSITNFCQALKQNLQKLLNFCCVKVSKIKLNLSLEHKKWNCFSLLESKQKQKLFVNLFLTLLFEETFDSFITSGWTRFCLQLSWISDTFAVLSAIF